MKRNRRTSILQDAMMRGPATYHKPTGFTENFQAAIGLTMLDNLSWSGAFWHDYNEQNRRTVFELQQSGVLTPEEVGRFRHTRNAFDPSLDYNALAAYLQEEKGITDVLTDAQIKEKNDIQEEALLGYGRKVQANANVWGKMGGFLGSIPAYAMDPMFAASMFIPVGHAARGASLLTRSTLAAGRTAATEGALELARQPMIYAWRTEMGRDYSLSQGLAEVAMATVGAGFLGGAAELARGIRTFRKKSTVAPGDELAAKEMDDLADLLDKSPEGLRADAHLQRLQDEIDHINAYPSERGALLDELSAPAREVSARADPSSRIDADIPWEAGDEAVAKMMAQIPEELLTEDLDKLMASINILEEGGELVVKTQPVADALQQLRETGNSLRKAFDCLFAA